MKSKLIITLILFISQFAIAQTSVTVRCPETAAAMPISGPAFSTSIPSTIPSITKIVLNLSAITATNKIVVVLPPTLTIVPNTATLLAVGDNTLTFSNNILGITFGIVEQKTVDSSPVSGGVDIQFTAISASAPSPTVPVTPEPEAQSVTDYINTNYSTFEETPFGLIDPSDKKLVHLFFDQFGNSLLSTIPAGISNAKYRMHIVYPYVASNPERTGYSVKQKTGTFSAGISANNTGILSKIGGLQAGAVPENTLVTERSFLLGTATDDLTFDITATNKDGDKITKSILETYTIKMSPVFHVSFDVGLLKTNLQNPTFTLISSPTTTFNVVKKIDESPKGVVTVMATFYTSPIVLLKTLFNKDVPFYKINGRSFLDDHKFYERIYPAVGVGINTGDKTFNNLFYGFNWEVARGLCLFYGWQYGKVKTFEMPGYVEGETPVSQGEFDFYSKTRWKTAQTVGVQLDILVITNLFGGLGGK